MEIIRELEPWPREANCGAAASEYREALWKSDRPNFRFGKLGKRPNYYRSSRGDRATFWSKCELVLGSDTSFSAKPGIAQAVAKREWVFRVDAILRDTSQPGAAGDFRDDSSDRPSCGRLHAAAAELGVDDRLMDEGFAGRELTARVQEREPRRRASTARTAVEPARRKASG